jgi:hypothetical protein
VDLAQARVDAEADLHDASQRWNAIDIQGETLGLSLGRERVQTEDLGSRSE